MRKFFKFLGGLTSIAAVGFGAYCVYKKVVENKDEEEEDFDDLFDDEELDENKSNREYVSINITGDEDKKAEKPADEETEEAEGHNPNEEGEPDDWVDDGFGPTHVPHSYLSV